MTNADANDLTEQDDLTIIQERLESAKGTTRFEAIHLLRNKNYPETNEILLKVLLDDPLASVRELALISLFERVNTQLFGSLKKFFYNPSENRFIRGRSIWAIGQMVDEQSFEMILEALDDPEEEVLYWALISLFNFSDYQQAIPKIHKLLDVNRFNLIRQTIAWFLGMKCDTNSREILEFRMLQDSNNVVRLSCAWALNRINNINSLNSLSKGLQKEPNELARREMAFTMGDIVCRQTKEYKLTNEYASYLDVTIRSLTRVIKRDTSYIVRRACAEALARLNDKRAVPSLIETVTSDTNQFVRREIIKTLGILGDPQAIDILKNAKRSHYKIVVEAAKEALKKLEAK
ncbi:MAG: HEAT repeat domain-containing protein [Candidatus Heimdallarchaeota archaeon]